MIAPQTYLTVIGVLIYTFALLMSLAKTGLSYALNASAVVVSILIGALLVYTVNCLLTGKCSTLAWIDSSLIFIYTTLIAIAMMVWFYILSNNEKKIDLNNLHQEGREFGSAVNSFRHSIARPESRVFGSAGNTLLPPIARSESNVFGSAVNSFRHSIPRPESRVFGSAVNTLRPSNVSHDSLDRAHQSLSTRSFASPVASARSRSFQAPEEVVRRSLGISETHNSAERFPSSRSIHEPTRRSSMFSRREIEHDQLLR